MHVGLLIFVIEKYSDCYLCSRNLVLNVFIYTKCLHKPGNVTFA